MVNVGRTSTTSQLCAKVLRHLNDRDSVASVSTALIGERSLKSAVTPSIRAISRCERAGVRLSNKKPPRSATDQETTSERPCVGGARSAL
jgi:hypothetical protein